MYRVLYFTSDREWTPPDLGSIKVTVVHKPFQVQTELCRREWDAIFSVEGADITRLSALPYHLKRRWRHLHGKPLTADALKRAIQEIYWAYTKIGSDALPLVSVYTPTKNSIAFIDETYANLVAQTHTNWEWVVVDDGSTDGTPARLEAFRDPRIRLFRFPEVGRIGYLKGAACGLARGDILAELDHDDILEPDCLSQVVSAFAANPDAGMVYTNCAEWYEGTDRFNIYDAPFWKYRDTPWRGMMAKEALQHDAMGTFDDGYNPKKPVIEAMNVCPNHMRAFRRSTYTAVGGYRDLVWADDYDLMIRMFLHSKIVHIDRMLYIQRMGTNTWTRNTDILWPCFAEVRSNYIAALAARYKDLGIG